jgi:hypothetical protein
MGEEAKETVILVHGTFAGPKDGKFHIGHRWVSQKRQTLTHALKQGADAPSARLRS